jgi:hypothetical protein
MAVSVSLTVMKTTVIIMLIYKVTSSSAPTESVSHSQCYTDYCYLVPDHMLVSTFSGAQSWCERHSSTLVEIPSADKHM